MTLSRGWWLLAAGALIGALGLGALGLDAARTNAAYEEQVRAVGALQYRAADLSVAADALLIQAVDTAVWDAFFASAYDLVDEVLPWATPGSTAAAAVDAALRLVEAVTAIEARGPLVGLDASETVGPLGVPAEIAASMQLVASIGVELETAFDVMVRDVFNTGVSRAHVATRAFAAAALAFAALSLLVLYLFQRRIGAPLIALAAIADRVSAGDRDARADVDRRDEMGRLARSLNAMLDTLALSERTKREQALALTREKESLAASQRIAHVATWSWTTHDNMVRLSDEAFTIAGRAADDAAVPVTELMAIVHDDDRERFVAELVEPLRAGRPAAAVCRVVRPDGTTRTLRLNGESQFHDDGPARVAGTVQDVTDEYERREEAEANARLLDVAGRVARLGGWSFDTRTAVMEWSDVVLEVIEVPRSVETDVDLERGIEYFAPEYRDRVRDVFEACVGDGVPYDLEAQVVTARGRRVWVRITGAAVRDEHGSIVRVEGAFQDIDAHKQAEIRAVASEQRLRETLESLSDPFVLVDHGGRITFANVAAAVHAGVDVHALIGADAGQLYGPALDADTCTALEAAIRTRVPHVAEVRTPSSGRWFEVRVDPIDGVVALQARDVTERRAMIERLQQHEQELRVSRDALAVALESRRATFDALPANVAVLDDRGIIRFVNDGWRRYAEANGLDDPDHLVGTNYLDAVDRAAGSDEAAAATAVALRQLLAGVVDAVDIEYPCHTPDTEAWFRMSARGIEGGAPGTGRVVVMHVDITERMLAERAMTFVALNDPLTTLLSRSGFANQVGQALAAHWRPHCVIAAFDMVGFRSINDAHGYAMGDAILEVVAARLKDAVGADGISARIGGDSFAAFFRADVESGGAARGVRDLVAQVFEAPIEFDDFRLSLDVAIGYTQLGAEVRSIEELLREAEVALYDGVNSADGGVAAYTSELDAASRARARTTSELKDALSRSEFELHFQPKVDLARGTLVAAEALIRWNHPERGLVAPGAFVDVAEHSGLIVPIGSWVLDEACRTLARWRSDDLPPVRVAVNVSVRQLVQGDFAAEVASAVERHAIAPADLTLEITESVYGSESLHLRRQLRALHAMGVRLALDDFGTGFSSLQYLKSHRFDEVKIDRSFVRDMVRDTYSRSVVETILGIAKAIGAEAVAEGIETQRQRDLLAAMGCRIGQGYLFSAPVPEDDFRYLLSAKGTLPVVAGAQREREHSLPA